MSAADQQQDIADGDYLSIVADYLEEQDSQFADRVRNIALAKPNALMLFTERVSTRYDLSRPWTKGGYTWATDGRIMVRVDATGLEDSLPGSRQRPNVVQLLDTALRSPPALWDSIGNVSYTSTNGSGPCYLCMGYGYVPWHAPVCESEPCDVCEGGFGEQESVVLAIQGRHFSAHYIERIKVLAPDCEIGLGDAMLHFRAEGMYGLLMPLKEPTT